MNRLTRTGAGLVLFGSLLGCASGEKIQQTHDNYGIDISKSRRVEGVDRYATLTPLDNSTKYIHIEFADFGNDGVLDRVKTNSRDGNGEAILLYDPSGKACIRMGEDSAWIGSQEERRLRKMGEQVLGITAEKEEPKKQGKLSRFYEDIGDVLVSFRD